MIEQRCSLRIVRQALAEIAAATTNGRIWAQFSRSPVGANS